MGFWDFFKGSKKPDSAGSKLPDVPFMSADASPFGVRTLDLRPVTQGMLSVSRDPEVAARAVSWRDARPDRLEPAFAAETRKLPCELRYPSIQSLPEGFLFLPDKMEEKWVLLYRRGEVYALRSWTADLQVRARGSLDDRELVLRELELVSGTLDAIGDPVAVFDWMIRTHALGQVLPLPCASLDELARSPLIVMSLFGSRAPYAAEAWAPPPPVLPLRATSAIVQAVRARDHEAVRALAGRGLPLDAPTPVQGFGALHLAAIRDDRAMIELLLELGASPRVRNDGGLDALGCLIVHGGSIESMQRLAQAGADLHGTNLDGFGLLHAAAETDRADAAAWLAQQGLDLEAQSERGVRPVHIACGLGHASALRALLDAGADPCAPSPFGTPREIAVRGGHRDLLASLEAAGG